MAMPPSRRDPGQVVATILVTLALATALIWALEAFIGLDDASSTYLLAVTAIAVALGTGPAIATAVASFLIYNFFFTDPRFTFVVADRGQLLTLVLLLVVGVVVGRLAGSQRERARAAEGREREAKVMADISRALATASPSPGLGEVTTILATNTDSEMVWVALGSSPGAERPLTPAPPEALGPATPHVVLQRGAGGEPARCLRSRRRGEPSPEETRVLAAAADQIGQVLEQDRLRAEAAGAELARRSEQMKSALTHASPTIRESR